MAMQVRDVNLKVMQPTQPLHNLLLLLILPHLFVAVLVMGQANIPDLEARLKSAPNDESLLMELGRLYHDRGIDGDDKAVDKGFEMFDRALAIDSSNVVARAYRGSLWTLRARNSWWPPNKLEYMRKGAEDLDEAVSMDPMNIMVRLIRGIAGLGLPGFLGKLPKALEDFVLILRHPEFPEQRKEIKVAVFYYAGVACRRADDYEKARELFKQAVSVFPGSEFARRAAEELKDMGS